MNFQNIFWMFQNIFQIFKLPSKMSNQNNKGFHCIINSFTFKTLEVRMSPSGLSGSWPYLILVVNYLANFVGWLGTQSRQDLEKSTESSSENSFCHDTGGIHVLIDEVYLTTGLYTTTFGWVNLSLFTMIYLRVS